MTGGGEDIWRKIMENKNETNIKSEKKYFGFFVCLIDRNVPELQFDTLRHQYVDFLYTDCRNSS